MTRLGLLVRLPTRKPFELGGVAAGVGDFSSDGGADSETLAEGSGVFIPGRAEERLATWVEGVGEGSASAFGSGIVSCTGGFAADSFFGAGGSISTFGSGLGSVFTLGGEYFAVDLLLLEEDLEVEERVEDAEDCGLGGV